MKENDVLPMASTLRNKMRARREVTLEQIAKRINATDPAVGGISLLATECITIQTLEGLQRFGYNVGYTLSDGSTIANSVNISWE